MNKNVIERKIFELPLKGYFIENVDYLNWAIIKRKISDGKSVDKILGYYSNLATCYKVAAEILIFREPQKEILNIIKKLEDFKMACFNHFEELLSEQLKEAKNKIRILESNK